jgi:ATP-dependent RNA helicase DeaD
MWLFSATMPPEILKLAKRYMNEFDMLEVKNDQLTTPLTEQIYFEVKDSERFEALCRIIDVEPDFYGIVFCRTKVETDDVARRLNDRGYDAEPIHGDISQAQREKVLRAFKSRKIRILVATDVAARGIDVHDLTHVVNFHIPQDPDAYVHRIGRTGRAGKQGTAITFISPSELRSLLFIQKIANAKIKKQKLPDAKQVIFTKQEKLKNELQSLLSSGNFESYLPLAQELLSDGVDTQHVVAALLQYSFGDELKEESYRQLQQFADSVDSKGSTRLFVAKGKADGMNTKKLTAFLSSKGGIDPKHIRDVQVFDKFSFINVPFLEAEQLLAVFEKDKQRRKPLITRAKDKIPLASSSAKTYPDYKSALAENDKQKNNEKYNEKEVSSRKNSFDKQKPTFRHDNKNYVPEHQRAIQPKKSFPTTENTSSSYSFSDDDLAW